MSRGCFRCCSTTASPIRLRESFRAVRAAANNAGRGQLGRWRIARQYLHYWSGHDAWRALPLRRRAALAQQAPGIVADYDAALYIRADSAELRSLRMPVRLVSGTVSTRAARETARRLANAIPGARHVQVQGLDHLAPLERPTAVMPLLLDLVLPRPLAGSERRRAG